MLEFMAPRCLKRKSVPQFGAAGLRLLSLADTMLPKAEEAERDVARLVSRRAGQMRIAVGHHHLLRLAHARDGRVPQPLAEVELDIVSGFNPDPMGLIHQDRADIAIVSEPDPPRRWTFTRTLFSFEIRALLANSASAGAQALPDSPRLRRPDPYHLPSA